MVSVQELLAQRAAIEKQIVEVQRAERSSAIAKVKSLMAEFGLSANDIAGKAPVTRAKTSGKVAPKYRHEGTGETWTGRGLQPKWLKAELATGRRLEEFAL
jgi:DNA-binding protein H-NS